MKKAWIALVAALLTVAAHVTVQNTAVAHSTEMNLMAESGGSTLPPLPTGSAAPVPPLPPVPPTI